MRSVNFTLFCLALLVCSSAAAGPRIAVLGVEFIDTSPGWSGEPSEAEQRRIENSRSILHDTLAEAGYRMIDAERVDKALASRTVVQDLHQCKACDTKLGQALQAEWVLIAWVQKVSNLILNFNIIVRDVETGKDVAVAFVDLRGNTDASWRHATRYALKNILLKRLAEAQ